MALTGRPYTKADMQTRREKLERLLYHVRMGKKLKEAAKLLHVTPKTISKWNKEYPELKAQIRAMKRGNIGSHFAIDENLNAFMEYVSINEAGMYAEIFGVYARFKNSLNGVFMEPITQGQTEKIEGIFAAITLNMTDQRRRIKEIADNKKDTLCALSQGEAGQLIRYLKKAYRERLLNAGLIKR